MEMGASLMRVCKGFDSIVIAWLAHQLFLFLFLFFYDACIPVRHQRYTPSLCARRARKEGALLGESGGGAAQWAAL